MRDDCFVTVGTDGCPYRDIRPWSRHCYYDWRKEIWAEEMAPQWETFFIGDMPSRRDYTVAEIFMLSDMRCQSLQDKKADLICTGERVWQGLDCAGPTRCELYSWKETRSNLTSICIKKLRGLGERDWVKGSMHKSFGQQARTKGKQ